MLTSVPVVAILVANITTDWGLYFFLTSIPSYMNEVLKMDISTVSSFIPILSFWTGTISIGTDRPEQTMGTQIRCYRMQHLIRGCTVATDLAILDTATGCWPRWLSQMCVPLEIRRS